MDARGATERPIEERMDGAAREVRKLTERIERIEKQNRELLANMKKLQTRQDAFIKWVQRAQQSMQDAVNGVAEQLDELARSRR